jgi:hypothetical protein
MGATSPDPKRWPAWLWLAAAIFPPFGTYLATLNGGLLHSLIDQPWIFILLIFAYWSLLFFCAVAQKIWQRLEGPWLDAISQKINEEISPLLSPSYRSYYKHYQGCFRHKHQYLNLSESFSLEDFFVELQMEPKPAHQASADPLGQPSEVSQGLYTSEKALYGTRENMVILGAPGSGKTTILQHLGLTLFKSSKGLPYRLPILLHLSDIKQQANYSLAKAIREETREWQQGERNKVMPPGWIERYLQKGRCLVLLDGLDEIPDD